MDDDLTDIPDPETLLDARGPERLPQVIIRLLALAAAGVAGYLLAVSLQQQGLPLGCGQGSGCDEVLRSRWSSLFGLPVGAFAVAAYLAVLIASFRTGESRRDRWQWLSMIAVCIGVSAVWFVSLQLFVLHAVCPWCMADHGLGLCLAGLVLWTEWRQMAAAGGTRRSFGWSAACGLLLAGGFIALQVMPGTSGAGIARLPAGQNADTGPGADRQFAVLNGKLVLNAREVPTLGTPDAPKLLVLLFDYCCPHCRATHGYLLEGMARYPGQYGVVLLPMPLDGRCNPTVDETEPRFRESCDLARVALAVWRTQPAAYSEFDAWLYEPEQPRTLEEARGHAAEVIAPAGLDAALADPWIEARIAADVSAFADSGAETIPLLMSPSMDTIVGRPESAADLFAILERELGLTPAVMNSGDIDGKF